MLLKIGILLLVITVAIIAEARVKGSGTVLYAGTDNHVYRRITQ